MKSIPTLGFVAALLIKGLVVLTALTTAPTADACYLSWTSGDGWYCADRGYWDCIGTCSGYWFNGNAKGCECWCDCF
jgi:hypothetical protein